MYVEMEKRTDSDQGQRMGVDRHAPHESVQDFQDIQGRAGPGDEVAHPMVSKMEQRFTTPEMIRPLPDRRQALLANLEDTAISFMNTLLDIIKILLRWIKYPM